MLNINNHPLQQSTSTLRVDNTTRGRASNSISAFINNIVAGLAGNNGDGKVCFCLPNPFSRQEGDNALTDVPPQDADFQPGETASPTPYHNSDSMPNLFSVGVPRPVPFSSDTMTRSRSEPIPITGQNQQLSTSPNSVESFGSPNSNQTLTDNQEIRYYERRAEAMWERLYNRPQD